MSIQSKRTVAALVILAVLSGAVVALVRKPKYQLALDRLLPGFASQARSQTATDDTTASSTPDGSSDASPMKLEELPERDHGNQERGGIPASSREDPSPREDGKPEESDDRVVQEQRTNDETLQLQLSRYAPAVRKQLKQARRFYHRARKHNELVQDSSISSDQRVRENSKARTNSERALHLLKKATKQLENPDPAVNKMMKRVREIYRKSYRRAKMWGGY